MARLYPWFDDVLVGREMPSRFEVRYLDFVIKKDDAKPTEVKTEAEAIPASA
jgi:hypothetical protein